MARWTEKDLPDLTGKTVVVTGSNSGIGYAAAEQFVAHGARTIMACRDAKRAGAAVDRIRAAHPKATVEVMPLDLASLASVRSFSQALHKSASRIDVLVNNAGVMALPRKATADGFEMQFGTNYLGHYALTGQLMDLLLVSPSARVVTLSSIAHWFGRIAFDDLQGVKRYWRWMAYCQSKLACLEFALELQRRFAARGVPALSLACHPGYANTNLQHVAPQMSQSMVSALFFRVGNGFFAQSPARGALPTLFAATSPTIRGGEYIGPRGLFGLWGMPTVARIAPQARNESDARRLWEVSEELTGVRYDALIKAA